MAIELLRVLQSLYANEINVSIESDWDNGYTVSIGNHRNGFRATERFAVDELDHAAEWLDAKARELYPIVGD